MSDTSRIAVSVIYAEAERTFDVALSLPSGATVADAIARSGIRNTRPDIEIRDECLGIFARKVSLETTLRNGDRIEIYRSLSIDPKEARRMRAQKA